MNRCLQCMTLVAVTCVASTTWAQSAQEVERAQQHFQQGAEWFAGGEYAKAIVEFTRGHAIAPNAMFLYNISLCYERLNNIDDALTAAERAMQFQGMPPEVAVRNDARVQAFRVGRRGHETARAIEATVIETAEVEPEPAPPATVTRADGVKMLGWAGLALSAVGAGFIVGGVATNAAILREIDTYEAAAAAGERAAYDASRERIEKQQSAGKIFYGIGFAAVGVGATLFVIDLLTGTEEVPVASIVPLSDGAAIQALFHF